jgi:N6-adenosine-specific RNA methylase IME4
VSPDLEDKLVRKYPQLFQDTDKPETESLMGFGCECGDGWYTLLDQLCGCIANHVKQNWKHEEPYRFMQIKEKFGGLRVYDCGHDDTIFGMICLAESMSYTICEECGQQGDLCTTGHWLRTLCSQCELKHGYRRYQQQDDEV